jgi:hypothetical protein
MRYSEDNLKLLRNRDKIKDDAIAQLSDQVIALTARMHEIEKNKHMTDSFVFENGYQK